MKLYKDTNPPDIDGWMSDDELEWLYQQAQNHQTIVEVGSWCGLSTRALLSGCPGLVWAVDHFKGSASEIDTVHARAKFDDIFTEFLVNVGHFPNLRVLPMSSVGASAHFTDGSVDMVFLDGDHEYSQFKADYLAWSRKAKFLCGHDRGQQGVPHVLKEFNVKIDCGPGTIWVANGTYDPLTAPRGHDVSVSLPPLAVEMGRGL